MRVLAFLVIAGWAAAAAADLYRWVDPETGSIKFSSYPPPWYGDEKLERRLPKVEHIPPRGPGGSPQVDSADSAPRKPAAEPAGKPPAAEPRERPVAGGRPGT